MKTATPTSIADQVEAQINRSQWRMFKFSDLTENINEKISPQSSDLTHYIGLEHLDSGSLKIRRFGDPKAIKGDKLKIYKGDLIFAKRNAYLKRVSIAEFDAIASAHSMVLRAKPETVLPKFLPFFMLSDTFWERAIAISVGSLSPTINWKALAKQEFLLPPKDQQAKLAELLWAADEALENTKQVHSRLMELYESRRESLCFGDTTEVVSEWHRRLKRDVPTGTAFCRLGEILLDIRYGTSKKSNSSELGFQCVGIPHVLDENLVSDGAAFVELSEKEQKLIELQSDDILIVRTNGNPAYTGRSAIVPDDTNLVFASYLIRIRIDGEIFCPSFLIRYLQSQTIRRFFQRHATSSAGNYNINTEAIKGVPVPKNDMEMQRNIATELKNLESKRSSSSLAVKTSQKLLKSLINQIF